MKHAVGGEELQGQEGVSTNEPCLTDQISLSPSFEIRRLRSMWPEAVSTDAMITS